MDRAQESALVDAVSADADDLAAWEPTGEPERPPRRRLGTQLSVRLDRTYADRLRQIAEREGVGYTSLVRSWIEERIDDECSPMAASAPVRITYGAGDARILEMVQITGSARLVADLVH